MVLIIYLLNVHYTGPLSGTHCCSCGSAKGHLGLQIQGGVGI